MRNATIGILTALGLLGLGGTASAQELVANGRFDAAITGWNACCGPSGTAGFDPTRDADGSALSGSAELVHTQQPDGNGLTYLFVSRCLSGPAIQAGKAYFFGAKVRFREGQTSQGRALLTIEFRPDGECKMANVGGTGDDVYVSEVGRGTWIPLTVGSPSSGFVMPAGASSVRIGVSVGKSDVTNLTLNVDNVFAAAVGTPVCEGLPATIIGTPAADLINGTAASDVIVGRGGIDWIDGKGGNDRICGGPGADVLYGGEGDDRLFGEGGADDLYGAAGNDLLNGGGGNDDLYGGAGNDRLKGGTGQDVCNGEAGAGDVAKSCETVSNVP